MSITREYLNCMCATKTRIERSKPVRLRFGFELLSHAEQLYSSATMSNSPQLRQLQQHSCPGVVICQTTHRYTKLKWKFSRSPVVSSDEGRDVTECRQRDGESWRVSTANYDGADVAVTWTLNLLCSFVSGILCLYRIPCYRFSKRHFAGNGFKRIRLSSVLAHKVINNAI